MLPVMDSRVLTVAGLLVAAAVGASLVAWGVTLTPVGCACSPEPVVAAVYDAGDGTLTLVHEGGEAVPAGSVAATVAGTSRTWAARADVPSSEPISAGDRLVVEGVEPDDTVRVTLRADGGHRILLETTAGEHRPSASPGRVA